MPSLPVGYCWSCRRGDSTSPAIRAVREDLDRHSPASGVHSTAKEWPHPRSPRSGYESWLIRRRPRYAFGSPSEHVGCVAHGHVPPRHVETYRYEDVDIQELFVRGAVIITDYSSNAFERSPISTGRRSTTSSTATASSPAGVAYRRGDWSSERRRLRTRRQQRAAVLDEFECLVDAGMSPPEPYASASRRLSPSATRDTASEVFESILSARRSAPPMPRRPRKPLAPGAPPLVAGLRTHDDDGRQRLAIVLTFRF